MESQLRSGRLSRFKSHSVNTHFIQGACFLQIGTYQSDGGPIR